MGNERQPWAAVLGAVDMLNPGGAVLSASLSAWRGADPEATAKSEVDVGEAGLGVASERSIEGMLLNLELLGEGTYWVVYRGRSDGGSAECRAYVASAQGLAPPSDQPPTSASVAVSVSCRSVQLVVQAETGATEEAYLAEVVVDKAMAREGEGAQRSEPNGARVSILLL